MAFIQYFTVFTMRIYLYVDKYTHKIMGLFMIVFCGISLNVAAEQQLKKSVEVLPIGNFSLGDLDGWEVKEFNGKTEYKIVTSDNGDKVLRTNSNNCASGLFKEKRIDLQKTPYLNWSWKTDALFSGLNEKEKSGDDFVARIYIVIDGGMFVWKTKALNYVWSSTYEKGEFWPNPYISNATIFAVESGREKVGQWLSYKRNVREDLKKVLGKEVRYIDAIAVMTDSDSSGQQATSYYGDVYFSAEY